VLSVPELSVSVVDVLSPPDLARPPGAARAAPLGASRSNYYD